MLVELEIADFAIIDHVRVPFAPGMNVLTGETGAGKSIIIDALGLALGDRSASGSVRSGANHARIDATFAMNDMPQGLADSLRRLEFDLEDGHLILSRELTASGRSVARVNGRPATSAILSELGAALIDIHGQSDHLSLLNAKSQLEILDQFAGTTSLRDEVGELAQELQQVQRRITEFELGERERAQRIDLLAFQTSEIDAAQLREGEEQDLVVEAARLNNVASLAAIVSEALDNLTAFDDDLGHPANPRANDQLQAAAKGLRSAAALDSTLDTPAAQLEELVALLADAESVLRDYLLELQADPARLAEVDDRLDLIRNLQRKYGDSAAEVLAFFERASDELTNLSSSAESISKLRDSESAVIKEFTGKVLRLHQARVDAAIELGRRVELAVADLDLGNAQFAVSVDVREMHGGIDIPGVGPVIVQSTGIDNIAFQFAPNAGEPLKPLARIASGGEMARLMLALRSVLSQVDATPTMVFDEIDVGVGGRSGDVIGAKMFQLADRHQILAITHLPQIAVYASHHLSIQKVESEGRVTTQVAVLEGDARIDEIAAMIDGEPPSPVSRAKAIEMLERLQTKVAG